MSHEEEKFELILRSRNRAGRQRVHRYISIAEVERIIERDKPSSQCKVEPRALKRIQILEKMRDNPDIILAMAVKRHLKVLDGIAVDFPNFETVIRQLKTELRLRIVSKASIRFSPLLLVGPPGTGKTEFAKTLSQRLRQNYAELSAPSISASFVLSGGDRRWSEAAPGRIADEVACLRDSGLIFLLDEIDKMQEHGRSFPVVPKLLSILDLDQAKRFHDECLEISMNIEPLVSWILTANKLSGVSEPLLSRVRVMEIEVPTREQMPAVIRSVERGLQEGESLYRKIFHPLDAAVMKTLSAMSPRLLRRVMIGAYGYALEDGKDGRRYRVVSQHIHRALKDVHLPAVKQPEPQPGDLMSVTFLMPFGGNSGGSAPPTPTVH